MGAQRATSAGVVSALVAALSVAVLAAPMAWADPVDADPTPEPVPSTAPVPAAAPAGSTAASPSAAPADHFTIVVSNSPTASHNGTFQLYCHPTSGNHPDSTNACAKLDQLLGNATNPTLPEPGRQCSQVSGGPATAEIRGTWNGQGVTAKITRTDSCQTARWNALVPVVPPESS
jgi:hypothetical protein